MAQQFYVMKSSPVGSRWETDCFDLDNSITGPAPTCPVCGNYIGKLTWLPPLQVELKLWGDALPDVLFAPGDDRLVSERFRDLYLAAGLTGLEGFDPVEIVRIIARKKKSKPKPGKYFRTTVVLSRTRVDQEASGCIWKKAPTCNWCRVGNITGWQRIVISEDSWTGEDIFRPSGLYGVIIATSRFYEFCKLHCISGVLLIPSERCWHPPYGAQLYSDAWECGAKSVKRLDSEQLAHFEY